ncbi:inhibitor of apoptosis-promoting Bax1-domain-containing protein [Scheffersomyces xylosifermentans]|uniref:inhibitor of apoptosis-promoting Bax1-domain-containing protein n=1 Tax=Scheffersomyces xylosifermentans TaxID=1304137 RepID=UPI00315C8A4A
MSQPYAALQSDEPPSYNTPRTEGDNIPDDFKYSVDVASCELPIRQLFIRKVYALLSIQLLGTVLVGYIIRSNPALQAWCFNNMWLFIVSIVGTIGFLIGTYIKARSYPTNLILLAGFTLCEAYGIGLSCSMVESDIVVQALLLTFIIFIGLTVFAFQSKYDFTSWQGYVSMGLWALIGWGFVMFFFPGRSKTAEMIYSGFGAVIFSIYIIIDTQHIMKTAHLDDEIISTLQLYLDVINLFLYILRLLNTRND